MVNSPGISHRSLLCQTSRVYHQIFKDIDIDSLNSKLNTSFYYSTSFEYILNCNNAITPGYSDAKYTAYIC